MSKKQPALLGLEAGHLGTGILPYQSIADLVRRRAISAVPDIVGDQIQPASIDLRAGRFAYRVRASFLPGQDATVMAKVKRMDGLPPLDLRDGAVLEKGCVYVIPLLEHLKLPTDVLGIANPKSSIGRMDVLARLITDHATAFDKVDEGYEGPLYLEVAPNTFSIIVREGSRLNQLRLQRGNPRLSREKLGKLYEEGQIIHSEYERQPTRGDDLVPVTVDLLGNGRAGHIVGYRAKKHTDKVDIDVFGKYDPDKFWDRLEYDGEKTLILDPGEFYILSTCEEVGVPLELAAEMVPYYTGSGEYRVHYAGFFDPGFGWDGKAGGSRAVLEVRSYVPFMLEHGQTVGWLRYMPMAGEPAHRYGAEIKSSYQSQGLALSRHFKKGGPHR